MLQVHESQSSSNDTSHDVSLSDALHAVGTLQSPRGGTQDACELSSRNPQLEEEIGLLMAENGILGSLSFATLMDRRESVERAHVSTFQWIHKDSQTELPWASFVDWLRYGMGIYWINGKVGSGKSTLMRYVYESEATWLELGTWAGGSPREVYGFFFWNSGDEDQKSQRGLLRSLLFEILQRHRYLMPEVMPNIWAAWSARAKAALQHRLPHDSPFLPPEPQRPTMAELKRVFQKLLKTLEKTTKLCFLIDGLDEYEGDYADIIDFFQQCAESPSIKICISSRPLLMFEQSFERFPTLRLQDLTQGDIDHYVRDRLYSHKYMRQLSQNRNTEVSDLVQEIVTKAQGVFLWVKLVVRSLLHGLSDYNRISDLQRRVRHLPGDLEKLYANMLAHTDPFYYEHASQIFQIFCMAHKRSPHKTTLLQLSWADEEDESLAEAASMQPITSNERAMRCHSMDARLKSVCAGLLESNDVRFSSIAPDSRVVFLHRTVSDWIAKPEVWSELTSRTVNANFSAALALLKTCILDVKSRDTSPSSPLDMGIISDALSYAREAETELNTAFPKLLDQLDIAAAYKWRLGNCSGVYEGDDVTYDTDEMYVANSSGSSSMIGFPEQLTPPPPLNLGTTSDSEGGFFGDMEIETQTQMGVEVGTRAALNEFGEMMDERSPSRFGGEETSHSRNWQGQEQDMVQNTDSSVALRDRAEQSTASYTLPAVARQDGKDKRGMKRCRQRRKVQNPFCHWTFGLEIPGIKRMGGESTFYDVARLMGLKRYIAAKNETANIPDQDVSQHLLMRAVAPLPDTSIDAAIVEKLLSGGADPNFAYRGPTPWETALGAAASHFASTKSQSRAGQCALSAQCKQECESWARLLGIFLEHSADPYAMAALQDAPNRPTISVCTVLESCLPEFLDATAVALLELLKEKRAAMDRLSGDRKARSSNKGVDNHLLGSTTKCHKSWVKIRN